MQKKLHLKNWVLYVLLSFLVVCMMLITYSISKTIYWNIMDSKNESHVMQDMIEDDLPVVEIVEETFERPFTAEGVNIIVNYYNREDSSEKQEGSLIRYDSTYMPNTGILYSSENTFEVLATYSGTVTKVEEDEIFGTIIEITHKNNLISKYSSITEPLVHEGDQVVTGEIIAKSGINKVSSKSNNMLLFELIVNGENVNPENFYLRSINDIQ